MIKFQNISLSDIRIWIVVFFLIRLIGITNPPLEISHNWRQTTGLMVARNFYETSSDIRYPRVDDNNGGSGIIGMEFPCLNYCIYLVSLIFGYTHWYGRLINLLVSSIGVYYFYLLVHKFFGAQIGFYSSLFLLGSIWFAFSRKTMPDTFSISLVFIGIYYGFLFFDKGKSYYLFFYFLFATLGVLSKIPAGLYLALFILPLIKPGAMQLKLAWVMATLLLLISIYYWYFIWNVKLVITYGNWYNIGFSLIDGCKELLQHPADFFRKFYFDAFSSYLLFVIFLTGLWLLIKNKGKLIMATGMILIIPIAVFLIKSGHYFTQHNYYIIPLVPFMALVAGYGAAMVTKYKFAIYLFIFGIMESIANQQHDFFIKKSERYKLHLPAIAQMVSSETDLVAFNGNGNPQEIYLMHRKGWNISDKQVIDTVYLNSLAQKGCKYLLINRHHCGNLPDRKSVYMDKDFVVWRLKSLE